MKLMEINDKFSQGLFMFYGGIFFSNQVSNLLIINSVILVI